VQKSIRVKQLDRHVEAVLAALDLMDCFLEQPLLSTKQIIDRTGMTRNRIMRLVGTLLHQGYLMEGPDPGSYTTGPKLLSLGKVFESNHNLLYLIRPVLKELALKTGESATFYIREGDERVVLAREEGTQAIRLYVSVGQRMDLHSGASGKVLLAWTPDSERDILLAKGMLKRYTDHTVTDAEILRKELEHIRQSGYAVSEGERNPDAFALAAPVFERKDHLVGAISIAGPISRFKPDNRKSYLKSLLHAVQSLSERFN